MKSTEDSQQIVVEAVQSDIPVDVVRGRLGVTGEVFSALCNGEAQLTDAQFKGVLALLKEYRIEGF